MFLAALERRELTYYAVEQELGLSDGYIGRIARGRGPGLRVALLLRDHYGVPVDAWTRPPSAEESAA